MQFFLDTASLDYARKAVLWGIGNGPMAAG